VARYRIAIASSASLPGGPPAEYAREGAADLGSDIWHKQAVGVQDGRVVAERSQPSTFPVKNGAYSRHGVEVERHGSRGRVGKGVEWPSVVAVEDLPVLEVGDDPLDGRANAVNSFVELVLAVEYVTEGYSRHCVKM
jgi:hypothetical protein